MGNKTSGTASCENLVVEIHLPQDDFDKIHLDLKKKAIDLRSSIHFLYLNLPHPIDPRVGFIDFFILVKRMRFTFLFITLNNLISSQM